VKRGAARDEGRAALRGVAERLCEAGADALILACTELPLLLREGDVEVRGTVVPVIASTDALVARALAAAREPERA
jgi:aspartate racemase